MSNPPVGNVHGIAPLSKVQHSFSLVTLAPTMLCAANELSDASAESCWLLHRLLPTCAGFT